MEKIWTLNKRLRDFYGIETESNNPIFRIVWTNDQYEKRLSDVSAGGIQLLYPEVIELPKYRFNRDMYVLERLVLVPLQQLHEIPESSKSYEPVWYFKDAQDKPLPPKWEVCEIVIDTLYAALGKKSLAKYVNPEDKENPLDVRRARLDKLQQEIFGNETSIGDALAYKEGVGYTGPTFLKD